MPITNRNPSCCVVNNNPDVSLPLISRMPVPRVPKPIHTNTPQNMQLGLVSLRRCECIIYFIYIFLQLLLIFALFFSNNSTNFVITDLRSDNHYRMPYRLPVSKVIHESLKSSSAGEIRFRF